MRYGTSFFVIFFLFFTSILAAQDIRKIELPNKDRSLGKERSEKVLKPVSDTSSITQDTTDTALKKEKKPKEKVPKLESFMFDTVVVKNRLFTWQINRYLNTPIPMRIDTSINDHLHNLPFYNNDIGATYLGVSGSAAVTFNYFQRTENNYMYTLTPYESYRLTPDNIQFYNTRAPFTRFTYSGTLFANHNFEQTDLNLLHTQNITPEWNFGLMYRRYGGQGLLANEATDSRTFTLFTSYSGKRYAAQAGYIYNRINNHHNGGVYDEGEIRDTVIDVRVVKVNLLNAAETNISNTFFLTHSYGIPLNFFRKDADSLRAGEGTMVYFGNTMEYTTAYRTYRDDIAEGDTVAQKYYNNTFYLDPTQTNDTMHTSLFDGRVFVSLQPFSPDFIISKIAGGVGYRHLSNYYFQLSDYIRPIHEATQHNFYVYGNAMGSFQRYFSWTAFARYYLAGYNKTDFLFKADAALSLFPLPKGVHLRGSFSLETRTPDYFLNHYYSNHLQWYNNFSQTTENKIQVSLDVPDWHLEASVAHSLLDHPVIFSAEGKPMQADKTTSILAVTLAHRLKVWLLHLDTRALLQNASEKDIMPLPLLALNGLFYIQYDLVKGVLTAQLGADVHFNTAYKAYAYNPAAGAFTLQDNRDIGDFAYMDVFLNMKWKQATLFVKYLNIGEEWGRKDYFSAWRYIMPQQTLQLGISWPFYL